MNRPGFAHIAFSVASVRDARGRVTSRTAARRSGRSSRWLAGARHVVLCRRPGGNVIELRPGRDLRYRPALDDQRANRPLDALIVGATDSAGSTCCTCCGSAVRGAPAPSGRQLRRHLVWNCYPGARVGSRVPSYGFSLEESGATGVRIERFPARRDGCGAALPVDQLDLSRDVRSTRVTAPTATRIGGRSRARMATRLARASSSVPGSRRRPIPNLGPRSLRGPVCHTARWPQDRLALAGRRVRVLGTARAASR